MKKLLMLAAAAAGYVFGAKAGRERYDQIRAQAQKIAQDPRVQQKAQQAAEVAREKAPIIKGKASEAASSKTGSGRGSDLSSPSPSTPSTGVPVGGVAPPSSPVTPSTPTTTGPTGSPVTNPPQA